MSDKAAMHFTRRTDTVWFSSQGIDRSVNSGDSGDDVCAREVPLQTGRLRREEAMRKDFPVSETVLGFS